MTYLLYNLATSLAAPLGAAWLAARRDYRPLLARFAPAEPRAVGKHPIWIQACSVGEVTTAASFIQALRRRWPGAPLLLTVSTLTGRALADSMAADVPLTWFPFDHVVSIRRFLQRMRPRALVLIETELWPNVLRETRRSGAPVVLVNGRLSDKHQPRYERYRSLLRPVVRQISAAGMQNGEYVERLTRLGVDPACVRVTGNAKFDGALMELDPCVPARLRRETGIPDGAPVLVFGSTRPGDEALAVACWRRLRDEFPSLRLVVAPRHMNRLDEALAPFDDKLLRRSEVKQGRAPAGERVVMLDTVGELPSFYGLAAVAVVGGSFYPGVNGHNPIEPAALGVPTVFGPYMRNFADPARELVTRGGACQVQRPEDLLPALRGLLADEARRAELGVRGREAVLANQGAIERNLDLLAEVLARSGSVPEEIVSL